MNYIRLLAVLAVSLTLSACGGGGGSDGGNPPSNPPSNPNPPPGNTDPLAEYRQSVIFVGADYAWGMGITGQGVTIGVVDGGIRATHEQFSGRVLGRIDTAGVAYDPSVDWHGTAVASTAAGAITGPAPGAYLLDGRFRSASEIGTGADTENRIGPMRSALAVQGARVINVSVGGQIVWRQNDAANQQSVQDMRVLRPLVVQSAGNNNENLTSVAAASLNQWSGYMKPTDDPTLRDLVLYVGGYDSMYADDPWPVSGIAGSDAVIQSRFLLAPACNYSAWPANDTQYALGCGTSGSTAIVSGAAALLMSRWPQATSEQIAQALLESARRDFTDQYGVNTCGPSGNQNCGLYHYGQGLLDIPAALDWMQARFP
ncbi:MAG: S8 family serine peptidase [Desulfofustis sp.]|nr:S8 family serine peptidase [Desulfofustis sp.]